MEITGKVKVINETQQVSDSFKKRELVVTTDEQYPQDILIDFVQDKCDVLNNYQVGQNVKVSINIRGREWINPEGQARYFNSIQGWRIESLAAAGAGAPSNVPPADSFAPAPDLSANEPDDLPF